MVVTEPTGETFVASIFSKLDLPLEAANTGVCRRCFAWLQR